MSSMRQVEELDLPKGRHAGVSAQEVEKVLPEAVAEDQMIGT